MITCFFYDVGYGSSILQMLAVIAIGIAKYLLHIPFRFAKTFKDILLKTIKKAVLRIFPIPLFYCFNTLHIYAKTLDYACFI